MFPERIGQMDKNSEWSGCLVPEPSDLGGASEPFLSSLQVDLGLSKIVSRGVCKTSLHPSSKDAYRTASSCCSLFNSHFMLPQHVAGAGPGPGDLRHTRPVLSREEHSTGEL